LSAKSSINLIAQFLAIELISGPLAITDLCHFLLFVFYEDEFEQIDCVAKGHSVITKFLKHCLFIGQLQQADASLH